VFGKVCWNVKTDVDALLEEFHRLMFGAAAKPMSALFEEIER
jgi:alpha-glucuronidase